MRQDKAYKKIWQKKFVVFDEKKGIIREGNS